MENEKKTTPKHLVIILLPVVVLLTASFVLELMHDEGGQAVPAVTVKEGLTVKQVPVAVEVYKEEPRKEIPKEVKKAPEPLRITAVGDILLGRGVGMRLEQQKKGYIYPFEKVADILKKGDIVFGNLEESVTSSTHSLTDIYHGGKYVLKNEVAAFDGIKFAGFNLLNIANNHILDYYDKGLFDTIELLDKNGIAHAGAGKNLDEARKPAIVEMKGLKVGMLSYTDMSEVVYLGEPKISFMAGKDKPGVAPRDYSYIKEDIARLRGSVDILIISFHWGKEESFDVLKEQRDLSYKLLDGGADMILGHHPHQFQGIEMYKGKPIVYSMGNFILDQNDPENQEGFILQMEYNDKKLSSFKAVPFKIVGKIQVVPQKGKGAEALLKRETDLSSLLNTKCEIKDDELVFNLN